MAKKVYDQDGLDMRNTNWSGDQKTGGLPVSGRLVEEYIKQIDDDATPITVDETITPDGTNPVQGKAVHAAIEGINAVADIRLNTIEEGVYSLSCIDKKGKVMSTTESFSGGGGSGLTTKIVLTRISESKTLKLGDKVEIAFKYDQVDSATGESTGNAAEATVIITHGSVVNEIGLHLSAGSTTKIDVTNYIGLGSNSVRLRAVAGDAEAQQVSNISWTFNAVELRLDSPFNIASIINRGDNISIPFQLNGSGSKTLRMYLDGVDKEDRTIGTSSANGSFVINTASLAHGTHSVQMVAELELVDGSTIKSNSIYFDIAVREKGHTEPIVSTRFDYDDGTIVTGRPYIVSKQFDVYTLVYAVFDPLNVSTLVEVYEGAKKVSSANLSCVTTRFESRVDESGTIQARICCGSTTYSYEIRAGESEVQIVEPTDNMTLKLSATGRSNKDVNKQEWTYNDISTTLSGFKWGGDGWIDGALRLTDQARAIINFRPLEMPLKNATGAMAFMVQFRVTQIMDESAEIIRCIDEKGNGFVVTTQEARFKSVGNSEVTTKFAAGEIYNIGIVAFPKVTGQSTPYERVNERMLYLYINGIMSGAVQRGGSDSIYQEHPQPITLGSNFCTLDVYSVRAYSSYLTDSQMLDAYMLDLANSEEMLTTYRENDILDMNGEISVESLPSDMPYIIVTGAAENGHPIMNEAAIINDKKAKYNITEALYVHPVHPERNFHLVGGCIRLQGTSSLAYPIKNYRLYVKNAEKVPGKLFVGCDEKGIGGQLSESGKYSFKGAEGSLKEAAPVNCWCFKADYAESSSSHNTGMARMVHEVLTECGELTPVQQHVSKEYPYDVRTTVDGFPCMMFYRAQIGDVPSFMGKYNFNNDKSTEEVFGFLDIPGYHDQSWMQSVFHGQNPTECWEFRNNDMPMGSFLDTDFVKKGVNDKGKTVANWTLCFEARFPDDDALNDAYEAGTKIPTHLKALVEWVNSTKDDPAKFKRELADWFDVDYLCDYYMMTEIMGCVDQRVKNMMMAFWYNPDRQKLLAYMIFYDNDTILGVRNDGRLKYGWDIDHNTLDPELSKPGKPAYAYMGHDSVLWVNLRSQFSNELGNAYVRLRKKMTNDKIFNIFDKAQSDKFCERIYNIDAIKKYVEPKTVGVEVTENGVITNRQYSYLESMHGSRKAHRHWWLTHRLSLFDARYATGQYALTDITWKGNSDAGATVKMWADRDFYFGIRRESNMMKHTEVHAGEMWSYAYPEIAKIGTIFHLLGGEYAVKLELSDWGGFTDLNFPVLPRLTDLILGKDGSQYTLTELALSGKFPMLRNLDIRNYTELNSLDLLSCTKLESLNAAGCTSLTVIDLAEGCPLKSIHIPANYQTLKLRSLAKLQRSGIVFDTIANITGLWVENCAMLNGIDLMEEIMQVPGNKLKYVRVSVDMYGDGKDLRKWRNLNLGGIDAEGNTTIKKCYIFGTYRLTKFFNDTELQEYRDYFPLLQIINAQYSIVRFDDAVELTDNVSNLDNETGYAFSNDFQKSGHFLVYEQRSHAYKCIYDKHKEELHCKQISDSDYTLMADGTPVDSTDASGEAYDVMKHLPKFWYKGVNDFKNQHKYFIMSADGDGPRPDNTAKKTTRVKLSDILVKASGCINITGLVPGGEYTIADAPDFSVYAIDVDGMKQVRWPGINDDVKGAVFVDKENKVVKTFNMSVKHELFDFTKGDYVYTDVPAGATRLIFTSPNGCDNEEAIAVDSCYVEAIEPDWVLTNERMIGVYGLSIDDLKRPRSISGVKTRTGDNTSETNPDWEYDAEGNPTNFSVPITAMHYTCQDFMNLCLVRGKGFQCIDYEMSKDVANVVMALYGERDIQALCGKGCGAGYTTGANDFNSFGNVTLKNPGNGKGNLIFGIQNFVACNYEWMDNVAYNVQSFAGFKANKRLPGPKDKGNYRYHIFDPVTKKERVIQGLSQEYSGYCVARVKFGRYCDIVASRVSYDNSKFNQHYSDQQSCNGATGRVVGRSSYSSRLTFSGKIVIEK